MRDHNGIKYDFFFFFFFMGNKDSLPQEIEVQQERQKQRKETPSYKPASAGTANKDSPSQTKKRFTLHTLAN